MTPREPPLDLDALVVPLRSDIESGAAVLAGAAADAVRRAAELAPATSGADLRKRLEALSVMILDAQPAMAPLVALCREVLEAIGGPLPLEDARRRAAGAALAFRDSAEARVLAVAERASRILPAEGEILTVSASSTVRRALIEASRRSTLRVICLESRPMNEGRVLAAELAREGVPVTVAVDAATESLLPRCAALLMGADSVGDGGVVNKIGSAAAVRAAARLGVPVLVAADSTKLLPPGFPQPLDDDRPPDEVWSAPAGVRVWNRYFEAVPGELVELLITEDAALGPEAVRGARRALDVPAALRTWAAERG